MSRIEKLPFEHVTDEWRHCELFFLRCKTLKIHSWHFIDNLFIMD